MCIVLLLLSSSLHTLSLDPDDQSKDKEKKKVYTSTLTLCTPSVIGLLPLQLQAMAPQKLKKIHMFDLSSVVRPMEKDQVHSIAVAAFKRMLKVEGGCVS